MSIFSSSMAAPHTKTNLKPTPETDAKMPSFLTLLLPKKRSLVLFARVAPPSSTKKMPLDSDKQGICPATEQEVTSHNPLGVILTIKKLRPMWVPILLLSQQAQHSLFGRMTRHYLTNFAFLIGEVGMPLQPKLKGSVMLLHETSRWPFPRWRRKCARCWPRNLGFLILTVHCGVQRKYLLH